MNGGMSGICELASTLNNALLRAFWQGGLAILIAWLVAALIPRIPASARHWLWRLAYLRLIVCLFCASSLQLAVLPAAKPTRVAIPAEPNAVEALPTFVEWTSSTPASTLPVAETPASPASTNYHAYVSAIWLLGVGACTMRMGLSWRRLVRRRGDIQKSDDQELMDLCRKLCAQFGIRRAPSIYLSDEYCSPELTGVLKPSITLPRSLLKTRRQNTYAWSWHMNSPT